MDSKEVFPPGWETGVKKILCGVEKVENQNIFGVGTYGRC